MIDSRAAAITTLIVMALISPLLTALVVATTLLYLVFGQLLYPGLRRRTEEEIIARANEETYLMESIRAIRAIKLHSHEAMRENGWRNRYADVISAAYRRASSASSSTSPRACCSASSSCSSSISARWPCSASS